MVLSPEEFCRAQRRGALFFLECSFLWRGSSPFRRVRCRGALSSGEEALFFCRARGKSSSPLQSILWRAQGCSAERRGCYFLQSTIGVRCSAEYPPEECSFLCRAQSSSFLFSRRECSALFPRVLCRGKSAVFFFFKEGANCSVGSFQFLNYHLRRSFQDI